ncbi:MAG: phytanoyl-CoA dioxygenase family protein [Reyranella sp.]|uniref:phytanoyl-CoA dioxygenase family protein n=1 Tax=Reyranella sp. TaxID=1929291 RepID=UPI001AD06DAC|nr:phytanoyl-CoA dioxygenase family protein [Reyranella sp.]MBN9087022.1 phytanoyl-CoA dioxygenase family protein [Reyranella sp.]
MFGATHWQELIGQGYIVVAGAVVGPRLRAAQAAAAALNDSHPDGGWKIGSTELWREIHRSEHPAFLAIAAEIFDPLAEALLESVRLGDRLQLASTLPGYRSDGGIGKHFHIDGGRGPSLAVFNLLFGVALTPVDQNSAGGLHVLPGSHERFAEAFRRQPTDAPVHWGEVKLATLRALLAEGAPMAVSHLQPGDLVVAHGFLIHGVSTNASDRRRDMLYQRRVARPLVEPATQAQARLAFMRDPWSYFRRS